jgi:archaellum biogenesis ATPase FlaH
VEFAVAATLTTNEEEFGVVAADTHATYNEELITTDTLATLATNAVEFTVAATLATNNEVLGVVAANTLATYNEELITTDTLATLATNDEESAAVTALADPKNHVNRKEVDVEQTEKYTVGGLQDEATRQVLARCHHVIHCHQRVLSGLIRGA